MKKLISTLIIGMVTSVTAMTAMAGSSYDHHRQDSHRYDKKSMSHEYRHKKAAKYYYSHDRRDTKHYDRRDRRAYYNQHDHYDNRYKHYNDYKYR